MNKFQSLNLNVLWKSLIFITILSLPLSATAGEGSGKITRIYAHEKNGGAGVIMFNVETHTNPPASCPGHEWAFDANNDQGKAMYALLLAAASQGKSVTVKGSGDCAAWADRERPFWIMVDY
ncbi:hypothetical protein [Grimontia sp. NTOU-MAR1]|uniref:hypothetical protein n=1 Tax=Grimontia sp. NTOU-MAR1 TaxID=3111011 RepID=UPI002DBECDF2|nr:hypothetical protein [Grimontia sp. NTOU-MAR1]WRV97716.1 hypothetical protein VP504_17040 [Grimontia sp. NTOU-MAR1]